MPLDLKPLLRTLTIQDKNLSQRAFPIDEPFAWAQREYVSAIERQYNSGKPVRIIVLKARQLGISTATEGILFWWSFLHPGTNGLVVAHEVEASQSLFEKTQMYWDTWPFKSAYTLKRSTLKRLTWEQTNSSLKIATARNIQSGRGSTLHAVHLSEAAFYLDPETLMTGLAQTMPHRHGTIQVVESTANGLGNWFHTFWQEAEQGENDFIPMFFPWWRHPEYKLDGSYLSKSNLDVEEKHLLRLDRRIGMDEIAWRRWAIKNLCMNDEDVFHQEYPSTPNEAFVTSGTNIFPLRKVDEIFKPEPGVRGILQDRADGTVRFIPDRTGNLTIFRKPHPSRRPERYMVSGDPSETINGDPASIQVINRVTMEQVASWHGQIDPINFADEMMKVGRYYHGAMLCPEVEGGGYAAIGKMLGSGYDNIWQHRWADKSPGKVSLSFGWSTNYQRKQWAIGTLKNLIIENSITIHDRKTYNQLRNYVVRNDGTWGNADPTIHDDAVMSIAIGCVAIFTEGPVDLGNGVQTPRFDQDIYGAPEARIVELSR